MPRRPDGKAIAREIGGDCVAVRARMLSRVVTAVYDEALRPLGLRVSQLNILVAVALNGPMRPAEISRLLYLEQSTLSRNLSVLRRQGWLATEAGEDDRSQTIAITRKGVALLEKARPPWKQAERKIRKLLSPQGVDALVDVVDGYWANVPGAPV